MHIVNHFGIKGYSVSVYNNGCIIQSGLIVSDIKAHEAVLAFRKQYPNACVHKRIIFSTFDTRTLTDN